MPTTTYRDWDKDRWEANLIETDFETPSNKRMFAMLKAHGIKNSKTALNDAASIINAYKLSYEESVRKDKKKSKVPQSDNTLKSSSLESLDETAAKALNMSDSEGDDDEDPDDVDVNPEENFNDYDITDDENEKGGISESKSEEADDDDEEVSETKTKVEDIKKDDKRVKVDPKKKKKRDLFSAKTVTTKNTETSISTTWDVSSIVSDITDISMDDYAADLSGCEYEGFDPMRTLEILAAYAEEDNIDQDQFMTDMMFFAPFIAMRGTNKKSIIERTKEDKRKKIENLLRRYKVVDNSDKGGFVSKDKIILSRIVSCFPVYVSTALVKGLIEPKCKTDGLPVYLHHTAGASLISTTDTATYNLWLTWSKEHDKLINGKDADEKKVETFGKIIHNSKNMEDDKRAVISMKLSNYEKKKANESGSADNKTNNSN
jgi:hypothetical protein